jgi:hypothetical protein
MTLDELRARFWWLGPTATDSYIVALDGNTVTVKVIQCTWNRHTQKYEEALARDFEKLSLKVTWQPFWSDPLQEQLDKARQADVKAGRTFDEGAFVEKQRKAEIRGVSSL